MVNIYCFHGCGQNVEIFKSLLSSLEKNLKAHNWVYLRGKYYKKRGGWGWYTPMGSEMDWERDIKLVVDLINEPENSILIGFSEGGQMALDLVQYIPDIKGVVAMSPSYNSGVKIRCPVVLVSSRNEDKIMKKYACKWKKCIENVVEINHNKGHKVCLSLDTRNIIRGVFDI